MGYVGRDFFNGQRLDGVGVVDASDANLLAAFIVLIIPFLIINFFFGKKWDKLLVLLSAPFILNLFVLTRSRGGFVGVCISFITLFLLYKSIKNKLKIFIPLILFSFAIFYLSDQSFLERINGLFGSSDVTSQSSGRFETWGYGLRMLLDYPFGTGGDGFVILSPNYIPERLLEANLGVRVAHNTFIQVLVEQGYLGLFLYLLFVYFLIKKLHQTRHMLALRPDTERNLFLMNQLYALESALLGFWGAAFFIDRLYFEGLYLFCALSAVLCNLSIEQSNEKSS